MSEDQHDLETQIPELRLPESGDRVFEADGRFHETACIHSNSWWGLAVSYKETADIVVRHALGDTSSLDFVILPVCFLYRHYLEVALKALARDVAKVLGEEPPKFDHDLTSQWAFVRRAFGEQDQMILATDTLLREWMSYDPGSFSFRYPTNMKGDPSLPATLTHLNINKIADAVNKMDALFSGMAGYLDASIDAMNDAAVEMADDWY